MRKSIVLAVAVAIAIGLSHLAAADEDHNKNANTAQDSSPPSSHPISIPAGDLTEALKALAKQTASDLVYRPEHVEGIKTSGLSGSLSTQEALARLLKGTQLRVNTDSSTGAILIAAVKSNNKWDSEGHLGRNLHNCLGFSSDKRDSSTSSNGTVSDGENGCKSPNTQENLALARVQDAEEVKPVSSNDGESQLNSDLTKKLMIEEIVVTAQKRDESIQDVPISIGVLSGEDLEASGTTNVSEALNRVGGVSVIDREPGQSQISIRGAAASGPTVSGASTTGYYQDEAPFAFHVDAFVPDANAFDVERVEVLRGPQGTLYGVNSLSGVVRILTNDANLDAFEARGRARISSTDDSDGNISGDLVVNVPLVPGVVGVRAVVSHSELGGFIDAATARDYNESELDNYRLKINAEPTDDLDIELSYTANRLESTGTAGAFDDYTTPYGADQGYQRDYDIYSLVVGYDFPSVRLQSSTSYIDLIGAGETDFNIGGGPIVRLDDSLAATVFSQEVRFVTDLDGPWDFSGGVYYRDYEDERIQSINCPQVVCFPLPIADSNQVQDYAIFGEASRWLIDERLQVTAGIRFFQSTQDRTQLSFLFAGPLPPPTTTDFDATTWRALINYFPSEDLTLYASVSTGFRNGNSPSPFAPSGPPLTPDTLTNYEIGAKGALFDGNLSFDTALYYIDWEDAQQLTLNPIGASALLNADVPLRGFGIDASVTATPLPGLSVYASLGWNGLQFDGASPGPVTLTPDGGRPVYSPELTAGAGAEYRFPIGDSDLFEGFVGVDAQHNSVIVSRDLSGGVVTERQSDHIFIGRVRGGFEMEHWTTTLFVDNFTDERGTLAPGTLSNQAPYRSRPRTVGLQFAFNF